MEHQFRINLQGIIDLLSNNLYGESRVFIRELLQNGVDAIQARSQLIDKGADGSALGDSLRDNDINFGHLKIELIPGNSGSLPVLSFVDDGIGLTEEEVHRFLATIGQSSKTSNLWKARENFLGQFGIGLLSCFMVSEEIVVITRSARSEDAPTLEWKGRSDGTYKIRVLNYSIEPGTQVYLNCKPGCESMFELDELITNLVYYGGLLPYKIEVISGKKRQIINPEGIPWHQEFPSETKKIEYLLEYGKKTFDVDFIDAIPLRSKIGKVDGVAFVLPYAPTVAQNPTHRVYLKQMLLSEKAENLVPNWAFFVKCIINVNDLRPTASRESFYEDEKLQKTREAIGDNLRNYLFHLHRTQPDRLRRVIQLHNLSIKAMALENDDCFHMFMDLLTFETSKGNMTFGEYRRSTDQIRYVTQLDAFRQIAPVAAAQQIQILNAGYVYEEALLEKYQALHPDDELQKIQPSDLSHDLEDLSIEEREKSHHLAQLADVVLQPYHCMTQIRKFQPDDLPVLLTIDGEAEFRRDLDRSKEVANELWSSIMDHLSPAASISTYAQLCFNYRNPLVKRLISIRDKELLRRCIEMLYVQSLLLGHHPLDAKEMKLLNRGLLGLIEWGLNQIPMKDS